MGPGGSCLLSQNSGTRKFQFAPCPHPPLAVQASRVPEVLFATDPSCMWLPSLATILCMVCLWGQGTVVVAVAALLFLLRFVHRVDLQFCHYDPATGLVASDTSCFCSVSLSRPNDSKPILIGLLGASVSAGRFDRTFGGGYCGAGISIGLLGANGSIGFGLHCKVSLPILTYDDGFQIDFSSSSYSSAKAARQVGSFG